MDDKNQEDPKLYVDVPSREVMIAYRIYDAATTITALSSLDFGGGKIALAWLDAEINRISDRDPNNLDAKVLDIIASAIKTGME